MTVIPWKPCKPADKVPSHDTTTWMDAAGKSPQSAYISESCYVYDDECKVESMSIKDAACRPNEKTVADEK